MASRSQKTRFVKVILQGQNRGQRTGNRPEEKVNYRLAIFLLQKKLPKWLAAARKPDLSRSSFKVKSEVKGRGTGQRKKLQTDLRPFCPKRQPTKLAIRSQKTRFVKVILQGQIRGQRTGNGSEEKVTERLAIFLLQKKAYQNG